MDSVSNHAPADRNSHVRPRIWKAEELAKESKFVEAVAEYDFILEYGVDLPPDFLAQRGYFKFRCGDFEGCITLALTRNPELPLALIIVRQVTKNRGEKKRRWSTWTHF